MSDIHAALHLRDCACEDCVRSRDFERSYREARRQERLAAGVPEIKCNQRELAPGLVCQCYECQSGIGAGMAVSLHAPMRDAPLPEVDYDLAAVLLEEAYPSPRATMPIKCKWCGERAGWVHATKRAAVALSCERCVREGRA